MESVKGHTTSLQKVKLLLFHQHTAELSPAVICTSSYTRVLQSSPAARVIKVCSYQHHERRRDHIFCTLLCRAQK